MPTFMGTLQLGTSRQLEETLRSTQTQSSQPAIVLPAPHDGANATEKEDIPVQVLPGRGRKLDTELAIVLENVASGFQRPNVLDVKLGRRLWADDAPPAKRTKFDDISAHTTSGTLGFRVAGMRVWQESGYKTYDKWYGRSRTVDNVKEAFEGLLALHTEVNHSKDFEALLDGISSAVGQIEEAVRENESRMYSSSLLLVYEGDTRAREEALQATIERSKRDSGAHLTTGAQQNSSDDNDDDDQSDEEEEESTPKLFDVRLIDFAHAAWTPGQGPDENMLCGITSVHTILQDIATNYKGRRVR